jgi:hypothetical protein
MSTAKVDMWNYIKKKKIFKKLYKNKKVIQLKKEKLWVWGGSATLRPASQFYFFSIFFKIVLFYYFYIIF